MLDNFVSLESLLEEEATLENNQQPAELVDGADLCLEHIDIQEDIRMPIDADMAGLEFQLQLAKTSAASLERLEGRLTEALENGGLQTKFEMQAFHDQYEAATESFGKHTVEIPSLEAFEAEGGAEAETRVSIEGVKEMSQKAYEVVKSALSRLADMVSKLWSQYGSRGARVTTALKALEEAAGKVKGNPVEKELNVTNGRYLTVKADMDLEKFCRNIASNGSAVESAFKDMSAALGKVSSSEVAKGILELAQTEQKLYAALEKAFDTSKEATAEQAKKAGFKPESYNRVAVSPVVNGGAVVVIAVPKADSGRPVSVKVIFEDAGKDANKVDALKAGELKAVISRGLAVMAAHDELIASSQKMSGLAKDFIKTAGQAAKEGAKSDDKDAASSLAGFIKDMAPRMSITYEPHKVIANQAVSLAQACANLAKDSIKNLKSEKPASK